MEDGARKTYENVREKIVHEDDLVHQRLTWAITLNGLLFTAYGFSLGADASSIAALTPAPGEAQVTAFKELAKTIHTLRQGMTAVGIGSSIAAFFGVIAAYKSIRDDETGFAVYRRSFREKNGIDMPWFPFPIGRRSTNIMGMVSGLAVPFLIAGAWLWIGKLVPDPVFIAVGVGLAAVVWFTLWPLMPRPQSSKLTE